MHATSQVYTIFVLTQNKYYVGHIDLYSLKTVKIPETTLNLMCVTFKHDIFITFTYPFIAC